jgi:HD-like signal output (HDOD) protein/GGDEF domain-containing protein
MTSPSVSIDSLLDRAQRLYSLPGVAMKVLELTRNPQVDTHALKRCIENDPALTSKILRVVNSSLFGLSREVSDLQQALALLGTKPLKLLVLGFSLPSGLFGGMPAEAMERYWRRTLTKAVAARELSETVWQLPGDDAFIAGLLQDLGILVLLQELGEPYARFLEKIQASGRDLHEWEIEAFGFEHTALSSRLLEHWGLPDALVEAVAWESVSGSDRPLVQIVHLAEIAACLLVDRRCKALEELLETGGRYRGLKPEQVESLVTALGEKVRQLADVLSLQLPGGMDYQDILAQSQVQLAEVAAHAAEELFQIRQEASRLPAEEGVLQELHQLSKSLHDAAIGPPRPAQAPTPLPTPPAQPSPATTATAPTTAARHLPADSTPVARPPQPSPTARDAAKTASQPPAAAAANLLSQLDAEVAACRQARVALSLLLVDMNHTEQTTTERGAGTAAMLTRLLEALCRRLDHPGMRLVPHGLAGFALILPDCDRRQAAQLGNSLIDSTRRLSEPRAAGIQSAFSISVGAATVALPPKNFPVADLIRGAERCQYGSRTSGGSVLKSIEIY